MNLNTAGAPAQILVNPFNFPTSPVVLNYCPCQSTEIIDRQNSSTNSVPFWVVVALLVCRFCSWFAFSLLLAAFSFIFCLLNLCWWWKIKNQAKLTPKFNSRWEPPRCKHWERRPSSPPASLSEQSEQCQTSALAPSLQNLEIQQLSILSLYSLTVLSRDLFLFSFNIIIYISFLRVYLRFGCQCWENLQNHREPSKKNVLIKRRIKM